MIRSNGSEKQNETSRSLHLRPWSQHCYVPPTTIAHRDRHRFHVWYHAHGKGKNARRMHTNVRQRWAEVRARDEQQALYPGGPRGRTCQARRSERNGQRNGQWRHRFGPINYAFQVKSSPTDNLAAERRGHSYERGTPLSWFLAIPFTFTKITISRTNGTR